MISGILHTNIEEVKESPAFGIGCLDTMQAEETQLPMLLSAPMSPPHAREAL